MGENPFRYFKTYFANKICKRRSEAMRRVNQWRWRLAALLVKVRGETHYLWRAVDHEGARGLRHKEARQGCGTEIPKKSNEAVRKPGGHGDGQLSVISRSHDSTRELETLGYRPSFEQSRREFALIVPKSRAIDVILSAYAKSPEIRLSLFVCTQRQVH